MNFGYGHDNDFDFFCVLFFVVVLLYSFTVECLLSNDHNGIYLKSWEL